VAEGFNATSHLHNLIKHTQKFTSTMEDDDLQKIRQARIQQLQQERGSSSGGGGSASSGLDQTAQSEVEAEARKSILSQILTPEANDRLGRIALVKEERARDLENRLIMMAKGGQLRQRITDDDLKALLEGAAQQQKEVESKVVFQRRKVVEDEDEDEWYD